MVVVLEASLSREGIWCKTCDDLSVHRHPRPLLHPRSLQPHQHLRQGTSQHLNRRAQGTGPRWCLLPSHRGPRLLLSCYGLRPRHAQADQGDGHCLSLYFSFQCITYTGQIFYFCQSFLHSIYEFENPITVWFLAAIWQWSSAIILVQLV